MDLLSNLKRKDKKNFYSQQKRILASFSLTEIVDYLKANYELEMILRVLATREKRRELEY